MREVLSVNAAISSVNEVSILAPTNAIVATDKKGASKNMSIQIEHADELPAQQGSAENFTGAVQVRMVAASQEGPASVEQVTFRRGGRTHWHTHSGEQMLYFLEGLGRVQQRGERALDARPGDVARIPADVEHWHGAHPDEQHEMTHLSITFGTTNWLEPVSDEEYQEYQEHTS
jgi:quercetin dioxygenase-like cupin family protein